MKIGASTVFAIQAVTASPITKVLQLLDSLAAKVTAEGEVEQQQYEELVAWCEDNAREKQHELKNSAERQAELEAVIEKADSDISVTESKISELSASISQNDSDLASATKVRAAEHKDFLTRDGEQAEAMDTLERAIQTLSKALKAGLVQVDAHSAKKLGDAMRVVVDAGVSSTRDVQKLQALLQTRMEDADAMQAHTEARSPDAIIDVMKDLLDKAEQERADSTKAETEAQFNYDMLKQSLTDELRTENKQIEERRTKLAAYRETKAAAEGDLQATNKDAASDSATLSQIQTDCMQKASDHEAEVADRKGELKALAAAKSIIEEKAGGASSRSYGLLQMATQSRSSDVLPAVLAQLRQLGYDHADMGLSMQLAQLASTDASQEDVFAKVKGLIRTMLEKLAEEAKADAKEHEWCTTKTKETTAAKEEHEGEVDKISSRIDRTEAAITEATASLKELESELGALNKMQGDMDKQRGEEHAGYQKASKDYEAGIEGVQMAIKVLKEYYGKNNALLQASSATGIRDGNGIIGLLEVAESDFSKLAAEVEADEKSAEEEYARQTKANKVAKKEKETSIKYTKKQITRGEKALTELTDDRDAAQGELDGVLEYLSKINKRCIAKPETYEQRVAKRQAEIDGLKNALKILAEETAGSESFLAVRANHRHQ
mmetsp:Transcript_32615/g.78367  ORF Transcript_32615/g.78367 Transcript_32615/m.78367 type:complete len:665 (-) Transcript_32615:90-2084(-)